jgi:hypothetical protein
MRLPIPNAEEVEAFRVLCKKKFSLELNPDEALHYATKIVQLFYVRYYGVHPLCPPGEREQASIAKQSN